MTNDEGQVVLECRSMGAQRGKLEVAWGVELTLRAGEVVALLGANGAGKTSTVEGIAGLVRTTGEVLLGNLRIDSLRTFQRARRGLALVPEDRGLFGDLNVEDNLLLGASVHGARSSDINDVLDIFPTLKTRLRQRSSTLSGGEQQMLAIGRAMAAKPHVLIVDEPTQGLAPRIYDDIIAALGAIKARGVAVLLVEQNIEFASRIADRYLVMSGGQIVSSGDRQGLKQDGELFAHFFHG